MTTISTDGKLFEQIRYGVEVKLIPKDGKEEDTIFLTDSVAELRIIKSYDDTFMPYYRLSAAISVNQAERIQAAWRTGKLYITMKKIKAIKGENGPDTGQRMEDTGQTYIKNGEFRILVCDGAPPHAPTGQSNELVRDVPSVLYAMELAPTIPLDMNKGICNSAFHDVTTAELVASVASDALPPEYSSQYKFVMSPPDNKKRYETIFIPPQNFVPTVRHVDRVYGLYAGKMSIFLDVDRGYILSSTKATGGGPKDPASVIFEVMPPNEGNPERLPTGSAYDQDTRTFRVRTNQRIAAAIDGPAMREVNGESIKLVRSTTDERSGSNCKSLSTDYMPNILGKKKEVVAWQKFDNPLTADRMKIQAREQYAPSTVTFSDCDLRAFDPNLQWTLLTEAEQLAPMEGQWRLKATEFVLTKAPGTTEPCAVEVMARLVPAVSTDPAAAEKARDQQNAAAAAKASAAPSSPNAPATVSPLPSK